MLNSYRKIFPGGIFEKMFLKKKGVNNVSFGMGIFIGIVIGLILTILFYPNNKNSTKPSGTFVIDFSDPTKDVCRLELDESLNTIYTKKQMILTIKTYGENSLN